MSEIRAGQRVVCVDDKSLNGRGITRPRRGVTYTVREVVPEGDGRVGIRLVEIRNPLVKYHDGRAECTFSQDRFQALSSNVIKLFTGSQ